MHAPCSAAQSGTPCALHSDSASYPHFSSPCSSAAPRLAAQRVTAARSTTCVTARSRRARAVRSQARARASRTSTWDIVARRRGPASTAASCTATCAIRARWMRAPMPRSTVVETREPHTAAPTTRLHRPRRRLTAGRTGSARPVADAGRPATPRRTTPAAPVRASAPATRTAAAMSASSSTAASVACVFLRAARARAAGGRPAHPAGTACRPAAKRTAMCVRRARAASARSREATRTAVRACHAPATESAAAARA